MSGCPYLLDGGDDYGICEINGRSLKISKVSSFCETTTFSTCPQYLSMAEENEEEE